MIRQVKKRAIALMMVCMLAALMSIQLLTVFAADARIAFSDPTGNVGSQINIKMKITSNDNLASADVMLSYDASLLEFVSGTNASGENGAVQTEARRIQVHWLLLLPLRHWLQAPARFL